MVEKDVVDESIDQREKVGLKNNTNESDLQHTTFN